MLIIKGRGRSDWKKLRLKIGILESQHKTCPQSPLPDQLLTLRQELRSLLLHSYDHVHRKLKATTYSTSKKAGKRLAQRLKDRHVKTKIHTLFHHQNQAMLTNPQDIANAFSDYYSDLYNLNTDQLTPQHPPQDINHFLHNLQLPTLTPEQLLTLNAPFSQQEIRMIIHALPLNKAPGPDGFSGEYYKQFTEHLAPHLVDVFNVAASSLHLQPEMLKALIITIPKPGKEPSTPQNFRPISLLNIDVKLYSKTIAMRLLDIMPTLIQRDQSGFTKGRQASDATRRLIDVIHYAESTGMPSLLRSLNAEKAFEGVHWTYLSSVLRKF